MTNSRSPSTASILNALDQHVKLFINQDRTYSPTSVAQGLHAAHGHQAFLKGTAIATFNATHASDKVCPVMHGKFIADVNGYAKNLHLGTTRIWNKDNSINEERWKKFVDFVTEGQENSPTKMVTRSRLQAYLAKCANEDPEELDTGRNAQSFFSSKVAQCYAATAAWDETFDRLANGWVPKADKPHEYEPFMELSLVRLFFENTEAAFQKAISGETPATKPQLRR